MKKLRTFEPTIKYYDLQMELNDLSLAPSYALPIGYKFEFWQDNSNFVDWLIIHFSTGEFASAVEAKNTFDDFYSNILEELNKRVLFIINENGEKIATATLSPCAESKTIGVIDWFAVSKAAQGKKLSKPLLSKIIELAKNFGLSKIILHTQTNSWLAAKVYLDFGFEPIITENVEGWKILKSIINHPKLANFDRVTEEQIFDPLILNIQSELEKMHKNFDFNVWYTDGRNAVFVREEVNYFKYAFYDNGKTLIKIES